jgi:hypothetical protein
MEASKIFTRVYNNAWWPYAPSSSQRQVYAWVRADAGKGGRGMMGIDYFFFTRQKRCVDDICTYGSFESNYAGLQ